jgi:hypothetical protein
MNKSRRELVTHVFEGPRFEDHGVDIDVLPDLIAYKTILVETAKELWRRHHPDRVRLPANFEQSLVVKFYEIDKGSAAIPLYREIVAEDQMPIWQGRDELDEAVDLVAESITATDEDRPLPEGLPKTVMPLFADYGKTLRSDERIVQKLPSQSKLVRYTAKVRERIITWTQKDYEDRINLAGEVRSADVDGLNFTLRIDDGTKIPGKFQPAQEKQFTDALCEHASRRLRIIGRADFSAADGKPKRIISVELVQDYAADEEAFDPNARPIWDVAADIAAQVPDSEWDKVPADLSKNVDHHLYGSPPEEE